MDEPIVNTENGLLRGVIKRSIEGYKYYAFKGIPYAKPPIGDLRFKDPELLGKWFGIKDAVEYGNICAQYDILLRTYIGSEDCLYLNVFVKSIKDVDVQKPVMVWIHGGGFTFGSGNDLHFGPDYLMRKDIVLVTINYRLGIFGFLNLEDEVAPGNQGLKDQVMALRWVQANIRQFGGDPNNVTIFGESGGSTSVHYLTLSPMAKGLFHKAICQSGVALNSWARIRDPKRYIYQLCNFLGKYLQDSKEIVAFLKAVKSEQIVQAQEKVKKSSINVLDKLNYIPPFGPGVDNNSLNPFMPIPVEVAALEGIHLPLLVGYNSREGMGYLIELKEKVFEDIDRNFAKMIHPRSLEILNRYGLTPEDLRRMYFGNEKISWANRDTFGDMTVDLHLIDGTHRTIKLQAQKSSSPTYVYKFSYDEELSLTRSSFRSPFPGACHFDEIEYIWFVNLRIRLGFKPLQKGTRGYRLMQQMTEMWTNFATYGSPTPVTSDLIPTKWLALDDGTNIRYLNIDKELKMETMINIEQRFLAAEDNI